MADEPPTSKKDDDSDAAETERDAVVLSMPAIYADSYNVWVNPTFTRMIFGDFAISRRENVRASIIMPTADAEALAEAILKLVKDTKEEEETGKSKEQDTKSISAPPRKS